MCTQGCFTQFKLLGGSGAFSIMQIRLKQTSSLHCPPVQLCIFSPLFGLGLLPLVLLVLLVLLVPLVLLVLVLLVLVLVLWLILSGMEQHRGIAPDQLTVTAVVCRTLIRVLLNMGGVDPSRH